MPLSQATTSSLEALKAFSLGVRAGIQKSTTQSIAYYQRAVELDPEFAAAYRGLANSYASLAELGRASEYQGKAFDIPFALQRARKTCDRSRLLPFCDRRTRQVGADVSGSGLRIIRTTMPPTAPWASRMPRWRSTTKLRKPTRENLRLAPDVGAPYMNLGNCLLALQRFDEARQTAKAALVQNFDDYILRNELYALAFIGQDTAAREEQAAWFRSQPDSEHFGLALESDTLAYSGQLSKARDFTKQAMESAVRNDSKENAAIWQDNQALREAAFGNLAEARSNAEAALKLEPGSQSAQLEAALALAMAGENASAESLARDLDHRFPLDTQVQSLWLPAIQAQLELNRKNPAAAIDRLEASSAHRPGANPVHQPIFPACIRYTSAARHISPPGKGMKPQQSFRKLSTTAASSGTAGRDRWPISGWPAPTRSRETTRRRKQPTKTFSLYGKMPM